MIIYNIIGKNYHLIDTLERIGSKDSFTVPQNKIGSGNGATEWHIGSKNNASLYEFFNGYNFNVKCFLKKSDLIWLMNELRPEYEVPSQAYRKRNSFFNLWNERMEELGHLNEFEFFIFREHDSRDSNDKRLYAKRPGLEAEGDNIYELIRKLALPNITFVSILKLRADDGEILFYFKIFPDFHYDNQLTSIDENIINEINNSPNISDTTKIQLIKSRIGQGKFREQLINECCICPITGVDDRRLLIASHIKPWKVSNNRERLFVKNGLLFTPTYDKLFDNGYISFTDDKRIIISPWVSNENIMKLNIQNNQKFPFLPIRGRENFLNYHRNNILKN